MTQAMHLILIIEDEPAIRAVLRVLLEAQGYRCAEADTVMRAEIEARSHKPDLLLIDLGLPDGDGLKVIRRVRRSYALVATGLFTGLRAMEILGLQWGDIDFKGGEIRARYQLSRQGKRVPLKTKAAKRDIVLMDSLGGLLRRQRLAERFSADSDFVFQSTVPQVPMTYRAFLIAFHDARDAAGLADLTPHALRHTFASILIAQGRDVQFVSRQLGHTKVSTTWDTYIHLFEARKHAQSARDELQAEYGGMLGGGS